MVQLSESLDQLQAAIHYSFTDLSLLDHALRHKSAGKPNNERLEFLGDAILGAVIAETLYRNDQLLAEGNMTVARASVVSGESLSGVARELGLDAQLVLGKGERGGGEIRSSILEDAVEALIGAVFLDSNYETVRQFVLNLLGHQVDAAESGAVTKDPKTALQELMQSRKCELPVYTVLDTEGPAHERVFTVSCTVEGSENSTQAKARSRREAEREAAKAMLTALQAAE